MVKRIFNGTIYDFWGENLTRKLWMLQLEAPLKQAKFD